MEYTTKKEYIIPTLNCIVLDNLISLALESAPPEGPNEVFQYFESQISPNSNLFKA